MRKLVLTAASVVALAVSIPAAAATVASAHGSGRIEFGTNVEANSFTAFRQDDGTVTGHAVIHDVSAGVGAFVDVDCLTVAGQTATISGIVTRSSDPALVGDQAAFQVFDSGQPGGAGDFMSLVNFYAVGIGPDCTVPAEYDLAPITNGNIVVEG
jgi:hypothetical protein